MPTLPAENGKKGEIRNSPRRPFSLLPLSFFHSFLLFSLPLSEGAFPSSSLPRSKGRISAFLPAALRRCISAFLSAALQRRIFAFPPLRFKGAFPPFSPPLRSILIASACQALSHLFPLLFPASLEKRLFPLSLFSPDPSLRARCPIALHLSHLHRLRRIAAISINHVRAV